MYSYCAQCTVTHRGYCAQCTITVHDAQLLCTKNLLDFYSKNYPDIKTVYVKYSKKLCALHIECGNFAEAGFTLLPYQNIITWDSAPLSSDDILCSTPRKNEKCQTNGELKEKLCYEIMDLFLAAQMWEEALKIYKIVLVRYEVNEALDHRQSMLCQKLEHRKPCSYGHYNQSNL